MPQNQSRLRIGIAVTVGAVAVLGGATALAASASQHAVLAVQPAGTYVFACVNETNGKLDYFEFKNPLPHQCNAGDELWHLAAGPATVTPSATPTPTASPTPTATPSPSATPTPSVTPTPTPTATPSPSATPTPSEIGSAQALASPVPSS